MANSGIRDAKHDSNFPRARLYCPSVMYISPVCPISKAVHSFSEVVHIFTIRDHFKNYFSLQYFSVHLSHQETRNNLQSWLKADVSIGDDFVAAAGSFNSSARLMYSSTFPLRAAFFVRSISANKTRRMHYL